MNQVTINNEKARDLNERMLKALSNNPKTSEAAIEVVNENGMITLMGEVEDAETRQTAEQLVKNESGVLSVANNLKVKATS